MHLIYCSKGVLTQINWRTKWQPPSTTTATCTEPTPSTSRDVGGKIPKTVSSDTQTTGTKPASAHVPETQPVKDTEHDSSTDSHEQSPDNIQDMEHDRDTSADGHKHLPDVVPVLPLLGVLSVMV